MGNKCEGVANVFELFTKLNRLMMQSKKDKKRQLSKMEFFIVIVLGTREVMSMSELANKVGTSKEQASRLVNSLEKSGLVIREVNENNRRMVDVRLTSQGEQFKKDRERELLDIIDQELEGVSSEKYQELMLHVESIINILEEVLEDTP